MILLETLQELLSINLDPKSPFVHSRESREAVMLGVAEFGWKDFAVAFVKYPRDSDSEWVAWKMKAES